MKIKYEMWVHKKNLIKGKGEIRRGEVEVELSSKQQLDIL